MRRFRPGPGVLTAGALAVTAASVAVGYLGTGRHRQLGATAAEVRETLPGDDLVPVATMRSTRAITVDAPPEYVWPWIAQLGQTKGGFYTYTWLENLVGCQMTNADRIVAAWQHPQVGDPFHLHPELALQVAQVEDGRALVVQGRQDPALEAAKEKKGVEKSPGFDFSWAFVVRPEGQGRTRLLIRERYLPHSGGAAVGVTAAELVSTVMTVGTLRGVRERAERLFHSGA